MSNAEVEEQIQVFSKLIRKVEFLKGLDEDHWYYSQNIEKKTDLLEREVKNLQKKVEKLTELNDILLKEMRIDCSTQIFVLKQLQSDLTVSDVHRDALEQAFKRLTLY